MPAEQAEPEQLDPLSLLGRVDPPLPGVLERARQRLRVAVAAEAPVGDPPRPPRRRAPEVPPDPGPSPDPGTSPGPGTSPAARTRPGPGTGPAARTSPDPGTGPAAATSPDAGP